MNDYGHWSECQTCNKLFRSHRASQQHMNDLNHWAPRYDCETCSRDFPTQNAANQHMNALNHWRPTVPCETCSTMWHTQAQADQHMRHAGHYKNYCSACDRRFDNANNLKMHLNSKVHRGTSINCPFCKAGYTTASGLSHHLERGACPRAQHINRETLLQMIRQLDTNGAITIRQIEWHGEVEYSASDMAYNGNAWECYLCHREFNARSSLNQHLTSPTHKQNVYHCPNRRGACGKEFSTLAALCNHLESGSCAYMRFDNVQNCMADVLHNRRRIAF
ncbi:hypothetical protein ASPZODRAFT_74616 [Penicilliopsis zonata CBS 506.65]|uniref:C2H2-type domain-containing protein n=1 Tax=Penicilliopsis zonata CBS 506.65 TaxID=1073090 RepID=A0A1L9S7Q6_9EURO|nr:hypothetical protein ASPZODRAFT_74616 [Penicilliopsis zonata CBS 506.65]OJJ43192.1 hypothetical protein ASPZODRAFT_74616 [Penicilliopsis zonata CBS 506.65]